MMHGTMNVKNVKFQSIYPGRTLSGSFRNMLGFYGEQLPTLEDHPVSVAGDGLFSIFAATVDICRPSPPFATWGRAVPW
jgi:hypothetical protein